MKQRRPNQKSMHRVSAPLLTNTYVGTPYSKQASTIDHSNRHTTSKNSAVVLTGVVQLPKLGPLGRWLGVDVFFFFFYLSCFPLFRYSHGMLVRSKRILAGIIRSSQGLKIPLGCLRQSVESHNIQLVQVN